ncbi:MAG: 4-hydroxy-tetrahydrodipicolinate reductase [Holosporales bacterium]|nr:4-hydroxy-tetrahydrodipicolinate reductase [Holosporales bacterium]
MTRRTAFDATGVCLIGAAGRLGRAIIEQLASSESLFLSGAIEHDRSPYIGQLAHENVPFSCDAAYYAEVSNVIVDFSTPESTARIIPIALELRKPLVCGVTGLPAETMSALARAGVQIPVLYDSNMSIGVAALKLAVEILSKTLDFDVEINEIHHAHKADVPSGTALTLGGVVSNARRAKGDEADIVVGRTGKRARGEIGISSVRGGSAVGTHTVYFFGEDETVSISHQASSRAAFAKGVLRAAAWLCTKDEGVYSMADVCASERVR